jgi:hypothetical protein
MTPEADEFFDEVLAIRGEQVEPASLLQVGFWLAGIALSRMPLDVRDSTLDTIRSALKSLVDDLETVRSDNDAIAACRGAKTALLN